MPQSTKPLASSSPVSFRSLNSHSPPPPPSRPQQSQIRSGPLDDNALENRVKTDDHRQAQMEQLRMLILGRLEVREGKLVKAVERAESDGRKYEAAAAAHAVTTSTTVSG